jgi:hypothetical protein
MQDALESVCCSYADVLGSMTAEQLQLHPNHDPAQWNARQVIEHLVLTYRSTARALDVRLRKGRPTLAQATPEQQMRKEWVFSHECLPHGEPAPEPVRPGQTDVPDGSGAELSAFFKNELEAVDRVIDQCGEMFGTQPMASHFNLGPLCAEEWRRFVVIHSLHHLKQMKNIRGSI